MKNKTYLLCVVLCLLFPFAVDAKIVFSGQKNIDAEQKGDIYVMDDNGNNLRQLTNTPEHEGVPAWSPDGTQIAFARDMDVRVGPQIYKIFIMDADGRNEQQLSLGDSDYNPRFLPDGQQLSFTARKGRGKILQVIDLKTGQIDVLIESWIKELSWSPDGKQMVGAIGGNVFTMTTDGEHRKPIAKAPAVNTGWQRHSPRWSPDGESILYVETIYGPDLWPTSNEVYIYDVSAKKTSRVPIPKAWRVQGVDWMWDSKHFVFVADSDGMKKRERKHNIYRYHLPSKKRTQLTQLPGSNYSVDWIQGTLDVSPNKKKIIQWATLKK